MSTLFCGNVGLHPDDIRAGVREPQALWGLGSSHSNTIQYNFGSLLYIFTLEEEICVGGGWCEETSGQIGVCIQLFFSASIFWGPETSGCPTDGTRLCAQRCWDPESKNWTSVGVLFCYPMVLVGCLLPQAKPSFLHNNSKWALLSQGFFIGFSIFSCTTSLRAQSERDFESVLLTQHLSRN